MGQKFGPVKQPAEQIVKEIRRATRRQFSRPQHTSLDISELVEHEQRWQQVQPK